MYLNNYISNIDNIELVNTINETATSFINRINDNFNINEQLNALLLGNVQSGKTAQMLGIISAMADDGYKMFLLLTTDNVDLHRQTYNRVRNYLSDFNVLNEKEDSFLTSASLIKPTIAVLKKNSRVLSRWKNHLLNTNICKGLFLVVFDDEADASSLNTLVNKNRVSTINRRLAEIKSSAAGTIYIEVTATPQAIVLQTAMSGWRPKFVYYFKPGTNYLGGNYFYPKTKSLNTVFTPNYELDSIVEDGDVVCPLGLSKSILSFLVNCAHRKLNGLYNCNFMIHPSMRINVHNKFVTTIQDHLNLLQKSTEEKAFDTNLREEWMNLQQTKPDLEDYEEIKETVIEILDNTEIMVIPLNSKSFVCRDSNNPDALDLSKGFNIVVGGNSLGRGITFPNLQTVYYCRTSKAPQADTFWQHSRIFGYDREKQMVRIFIPKDLYKLFSDLNSSNEMLIKQVEENLDNIQLIFPSNIKPTRNSVVDNEYVNLIYGGVNLFAESPIRINVETINQIITQYASEKSVDVEPELIIKLLTLVKIENSDDFNTNKYIGCIQGLKTKRPQLKCKLIVRLDRDIAKGSNTLLSPNDRILGDTFKKEIVLTMYRILGSKEKGWDGFPLWIPNIKFPDDCCFYDVEELARDESITKTKRSGKAIEQRLIPNGTILKSIEEDEKVLILIHNMMALYEGTTIMNIVLECQREYQERYFSMKTNDWRHLIRDYVRKVTERPDLQEEEVFRYVMAG